VAGAEAEEPAGRCWGVERGGEITWEIERTREERTETAEKRGKYTHKIHHRAAAAEATVALVGD
jgi:hypothetical protein